MIQNAGHMGQNEDHMKNHEENDFLYDRFFISFIVGPLSFQIYSKPVYNLIFIFH